MAYQIIIEIKLNSENENVSPGDSKTINIKNTRYLNNNIGLSRL